MDTGLANRTVLITGASGGLGAAMARAFASEGARVVLHYRSQKAAAERLAAELAGTDCCAIGVDLTSEQQVSSLWREAEDRLGPVEIVVANAGIWEAEDAPIHEMSLEQWNRTVTTDLTSV